MKFPKFFQNVSSPQSFHIKLLKRSKEKTQLHPIQITPCLLNHVDLNLKKLMLCHILQGFWYFYVKTNIVNNQNFKKLTKTDKDGCPKLISVKSRGSLIEPCPAISVFVNILVVIFRNSCNGMSPPTSTLQQFTDLISKESEAMSLFYVSYHHVCQMMWTSICRS